MQGANIQQSRCAGLKNRADDGAPQCHLLETLGACPQSRAIIISLIVLYLSENSIYSRYAVHSAGPAYVGKSRFPSRSQQQ